ncbi:hypothetical protein [Vitiosangium sp. GDMCC 1.1324]|uniref:hypothetical protein n=1 Tax=Vitiosangium sp. (strain GDMCC 1.1324) TaxID=2138576 RepID=UPI000D3AE113|nr:hypothetical protein [Vitiosangium sp. GDMCC 1.1324]PTL85044.1 hypothetical protein DAT35_08370 [Vitiosangium sp. GDMCC 1.1324]
MPPIVLYTPRDLVKKASTQALYPAPTQGIEPPPSEKRVLVGRDHAYIYQPQDCVLSSVLLDAASTPVTRFPIQEPGNTFVYNGDRNLLALALGHPVVAQSFNIYYLHWDYNSTHCVQLKSHANYFITAALRGCSIFVAGDPASPTVYHLNANEVGADWDDKAAAQEEKIQTMNSRFESTNQALGVSMEGMASATMKDYMPDMLNDAGLAKLRQKHGVDGRKWYHVKANAFRSFWKVDQDELLQFGTVFGVREQRKWAFYFQQRTRHDYEYKSWMSGRPRYAEWTVSCRKFWPA